MKRPQQQGLSDSGTALEAGPDNVLGEYRTDTNTTTQSVRRKIVSTALVALSMLAATSLNLLILVNQEPPAEAVAEAQYQSLLFSIASAEYYRLNGIHLVDGLAPEPPRRYEDLAVDDVGYPIALGLANNLGLISFSSETTSFVATRWELEASRRLMYEVVRHDLHYANRALFALVAGVATISALVLLSFSSMSERLKRRLLIVGVVFFLLSQLVPHLAPGLFVYRLHVHGVIAALAIIGWSSAALFYWAFRTTSLKHHRWLAVAAGGLSALLISCAILIRRSDGMLWLVIAGAFVVCSLALRAFRGALDLRAGVSAVLVVVASAIGLWLPQAAVDRAISVRETAIPDLEGELQPAHHPIYHALLIGIARSQRNNLGIATEPDVVELVQRETGLRGNAFSAGYEEASATVFWSYVRSDPANYLMVLVDNVDETVEYVMARFGILARGYPVDLISMGVVVLLACLVMILRKETRLIRVLTAMIVAYLVLSFALAVASTSPGSYGPAVAVLLILFLGASLILVPAPDPRRGST